MKRSRLVAGLNLSLALTLFACGNDPEITIVLKYPQVIVLPTGGEIDGSERTFAKSFGSPATNIDYRLKDLVFSLNGHDVPLETARDPAVTLVVDEVGEGLEFGVKGRVSTNAGSNYATFEAKATLTDAGKVGAITYPSPQGASFEADFFVDTKDEPISDLVPREDDGEVRFRVTLSGELKTNGDLDLHFSLDQVDTGFKIFSTGGR